MTGLLQTSRTEVGREQRLVFHGITYSKFVALQGTFESVAGVRLFYFNRTLEIMKPGKKHEIVKSIIGALLEIYFLEMRIRFVPTGSMTLQDRNPQRWVQPDESYQFGEEKEFPDLAIEVVTTSSGVEKLTAYNKFEIPEVWFWENGLISAYRIYGGSYRRINRSELLPDLDLVLLGRCVQFSDKLEAMLEFRNAIRRENVNNNEF